MNCPHCQDPLPDNYPATFCPFCKGDFPWRASHLPEALPPSQVSWLWFWLAILGPPLLTMLSAFLFKLSSNDGVSVAIGLFGSIAGGIAGGIILGLKLGRTIAA